jgi:hypothetical protein
MKAFKFGSLLLLFVFAIISFEGCYYDTEETLYPPTGVCDTANVTYSGTIKSIVQTNCNTSGCHDAVTASAGYDFTTYDGLKGAADDGSLYGSITYDSNWSAMPKNGNKLDKCSITKIKIWIDAGALNN